MIERLRGELARAREETVRARADAEAAARNNVGAAIVADAVRAASDATLDEDARGLVADAASLDAAVEAYARAMGATWRAEAGVIDRRVAKRGAASVRGGGTRERIARGDGRGARAGRPSGGWRRACARRRSESRRGRIPGRWCSREGAEERVWERGRRARDVQSSPRPKSNPIFAL